jgi:hypothetical protein
LARSEAVADLESSRKRKQKQRSDNECLLFLIPIHAIDGTVEQKLNW